MLPAIWMEMKNLCRCSHYMALLSAIDFSCLSSNERAEYITESGKTTEISNVCPYSREFAVFMAHLGISKSRKFVFTICEEHQARVFSFLVPSTFALPFVDQEIIRNTYFHPYRIRISVYYAR
jgi:hypothetical protein